ncbi:hypothetical protein HMPREF1624_00477 [Sporothrix schenckii ATCC 58251]|uniref:RING-type E3 ubiquitin transferase n=1 Tax=Sporothrix schenckii (strain ATCC 58251 / de Perez 2211183) TaxID=1391915 RepID=U7Q2Q4_SPOS1|nr:hypothetical protein HMPREF1624_00477 [Sporothrix schenckii ATCC 58251]
MASRHGDDDGTASTSPNTTIDRIDKTSSDFSGGGSSISAAGRPSALEEEFHVAVEAANGPAATRAEPATNSSSTAPSRAALEHPGRPASPVASAAPAASAVPFSPVPSAAPAASMTSTLPAGPGRTAQPKAPAAPATGTPAAAAPSDPTVSSSIPIRQSTREAYRPPSPPLPPVPFEWQSPAERRRNQEPAPLPPFPPEWTYAASRSNAARSQQRQPLAPSQTRSRSSTSTASSSAARRTSTAGAESDEPPIPPAPAPAPAAPPSLQPTPQEQRQQRQQRQDITLPRWQPDAEVTYCPICFQHFNIFVRKHHCSCSPHRITIPYQYIVLPPGAQPYPRQDANQWANPTDDVRYLGGGERVRLCNPCVPDPNTTPPAAHTSSLAATGGSSSRYHSRSYSSVQSSSTQQRTVSGSATGGNEYTPPPPPYGLSVPDARSSLSPQLAQGYRTTHGTNSTAGNALASASSGASSSSAQNRYRHNRLSLPPLTAVMASAQEQQLQLQLQLHQNQQQQLQHQHHSHHRHSQGHRHRPPPTPQIAEEDECPVCHNELPKRSLPNFETLREAHITECLETQSRYMGGSSSRSPTNGVTDASTTSTSLPANTAEASSSTASPPPPRMTGMFPYRATEKDCVDAAECTICLEDLEVGVPMARLECFCRFHERCIRAWFKNHPGRCPVHQHDNFGY